MSTLYLAWTQPDLGWWPVGRLSRQGSEYTFVYTKGAVSAAEGGAFRPLPSFPDFEDTYVSAALFPFFANRVLRTTRPDYEDFVRWLDLTPAETDPMVILARSGGRRETDTFVTFPVPELSQEGRYESTFFVYAPWRHGPTAESAARRLRRGDPVLLVPEPNIPADPHALRVLTVGGGELLGFVPQHVCEDLHSLRATDQGHLRGRVRRVNPAPAPTEFRMLCSVDLPWPAGFRPCSRSAFEPLHPARGRIVAGHLEVQRGPAASLALAACWRGPAGAAAT